LATSSRSYKTILYARKSNSRSGTIIGGWSILYTPILTKEGSKGGNMLRNIPLRFLLIVLVFSLAASIIACGKEEGPFNPDNTAIDVPEYVGYALATHSDSIAVIDLAEYEVVGIHRIGRDKEYVGDFAIGPDGNLYCPVTRIGLATWLGGGSAGKTIRVMNPATGKVVDEIEVSECPLRIATLPGGKALVGHDIFLREEGGYAFEVIDMNSNTVARTFYFKGIAVEILHSPEGKFYIGILELYGGYKLIEFDPQTNDTVGDPITFGDPITLRTDFWFETAAFATSSKIYAPKPPAEEALGNEMSPSWTLAVFEFPSGNLLKTISVPEWPRDIIVVGQKAYVTHPSGSVQTAENQRTVSVIDVNTDQVLKTIEVCPGPQHIAYSESTGKIYVGCVEGKISVIDPSTDKVIETIVCDDARVGGWGFFRIKVPR